MVELIDITTNPVDKIENIACVCYDSQPTEDYKIFKSCMKSGHLSVAEHSQVTFKITCSRACSHQLVRHRTSKPTQRSQRYCSENSFDYYIPDKIKSDVTAYIKYTQCMSYINNLYNELVNMGLPNEDARYILPNACETTIIITFDLRNLFHFFNERLCSRSQKEIRDIAQEMKRLLLEKAPQLKPYCVPKCERFEIAFCPESKSCGRHKRLEEIING